MNAVVAELTLRALVGRRRGALLACLAGLLLVVATSVRVLAGADESQAVHVLDALVIGTMIPLLALIAGTGAIGPEIDDGSIVYLLAKPLNRHSIALTKLAVSTAVVIAFGTVPTLLAGLVLSGRLGGVTAGYTLGTVAASLTYCAVYLALAVHTRHAVIVGLLYAVVWESLVGNFVPGARALSVQQWAMSLVTRVTGDRAADLGVDAEVGLGTGLTCMVLVTVVAAWFAGWRLRRLHLAGEE